MSSEQFFTSIILQVRSLARQCYRVFARCWPDRARRLYQAFDPVTQRVSCMTCELPEISLIKCPNGLPVSLQISCCNAFPSLQVINDEDGGILKKYGHSTVHDSNQFRNSSGIPTLATSHSTASSGLSNSSNGLQAPSMNGYNNNPASRPSSSILQRKPSEGAPERSLQSVLQASQQQVNAIESMLKGVSVDDQGSYYSTPQATGNRSSQLKICPIYNTFSPPGYHVLVIGNTEQKVLSIWSEFCT